jgi:hypothetical protein
LSWGILRAPSVKPGCLEAFQGFIPGTTAPRTTKPPRTTQDQPEASRNHPEPPGTNPYVPCTGTSRNRAETLPGLGPPSAVGEEGLRNIHQFTLHPS